MELVERDRKSVAVTGPADRECIGRRRRRRRKKKKSNKDHGNNGLSTLSLNDQITQDLRKRIHILEEKIVNDDQVIQDLRQRIKSLEDLRENSSKMLRIYEKCEKLLKLETKEKERFRPRKEMEDGPTVRIYGGETRFDNISHSHCNIYISQCSGCERNSYGYRKRKRRKMSKKKRISVE